MKLKLCVIGCGGFARIFADSLTAVRDRVDLYFASRDYNRAKSYSDEFGGLGYFGSYEEAAANPEVNALYICTPHDLHLEHTLIAASEKKHVLLEKPIASTMDEAQSVISTAKDAGIKLMVAENYRFLAPVIKAHELIRSGIVGRVRLVQLQEEFPFDPSSWRNDRDRNGGGVFIDGGIHKASVLAFLSERPDQVYALQVPSGNSGLDAEDGIIVTTRSPNGVVGVINHTWSVGKTTERPWVSVIGTLASLHFQMGSSWLKIDYGTSQETLIFEDDRRGIASMVLEFGRSILEDDDPTMTGDEGLKDLTLVLKAYESIQSGLPEKLA
ncbi:MAG: Gfo/Idh/MocA family oxidoreductase [Chloroflexota bacterium]|nr:Gfo/Idh/MocA family oxidoreductase [Chloroflexota bacterium]